MNEFFEHIIALCEQHDIALYLHPKCRPVAFPEGRQINVHPIRSVQDYCEALHEIGHIITFRSEQTRMEKEFSAWEWAVNNALVWTSEHGSFMVKCLALWEEECKLTA